MAEVDRSKRYANPPKRPQKKSGTAPDRDEGAAEKKVEGVDKGGSKGPVDAKPGAVGKVGEDPGPDKGRDATWGVVAERHKSEHAAMIKRHGEATGAMHESHAKEAKDLMGRHAREMQDHMEQAGEDKADKTAGSPKELGKDKDEGKKGSEA